MADKISSCLSPILFILGRRKIMFKLIMLGILLIFAIILLKKAIQNYKVYKEAKAKEERRKAFKKKMQELEIK